MPSAVVLRMDEAVALGHAWVQRLADDAGIRILFLKGPTLHRYGLRTQRSSSDVDVLVEPRGFAELCRALSDAGWRERASTFLTPRMSVHSRTLIRDDWPCDIDVHSHFPGFLGAPEDVFEALRARHATMDYAHRPCDVPDRAASVIVLALHSLRGTVRQSRHADELERLVEAPLTAAERAEIATLVRLTGSTATLESVLPRLGIDTRPTAEELASPELRRWRQRVASGSHGAYFWLDAFRRGAWGERLLIVWRAVWPSRVDLLLSRPEVVDSVPGRLEGRIARWGRGIRSLPGAVRAITRHR